jgi:hypothetical protein
MRAARGLALALLVGLLLPAAAAGDPLDAAKAAGQVGERPDGYLGLVLSPAPEELRALVDRINGERSRHYAEIASQSGTTPAAVAALAGQKLVLRTPPGQYYQDAQGNWVRR